jgi:VMA21-like domain
MFHEILFQDTETQNKNDFDVFITVFSYCFLIIFLPVISFFASKKAFEVFDFTSLNSNIYAAIVAVVFLHLALGLYLYRGEIRKKQILIRKFPLIGPILAYSDKGDTPKPSHSQVKQD